MAGTETLRFSIVNQIEAWLRDQIRSGALPRGAKLPSMSELQVQFGAKSISTVQTAQQRLISDGLIEARQGQGVFVSGDRDPNQPARRVGTPLVEHIEPSGPITIKLTITSPPPFWDNATFDRRVSRQWPTVDSFAVGGDHTAYMFDIDQADLEDAVAEFDCLLAETNAAWLASELPRLARGRRRHTTESDRRIACGDPATYHEFIVARANTLVPDLTAAAPAAEALALAQVLRLARDSAHCAEQNPS